MATRSATVYDYLRDEGELNGADGSAHVPEAARCVTIRQGMGGHSRVHGRSLRRGGGAVTTAPAAQPGTAEWDPRSRTEEAAALARMASRAWLHADERCVLRSCGYADPRTSCVAGEWCTRSGTPTAAGDAWVASSLRRPTRRACSTRCPGGRRRLVDTVQQAKE
jgi:hypothetical protein